MRTHRYVLPILAASAMIACGGTQPPASTPAPMSSQAPAASSAAPDTAKVSFTVVPDIDKRVAQFAPVSMDFDAGQLTPELKKVIKPLVEASQMLHQLFLVQVDPKLPAMRKQLASDPKYAAAVTYFDIMAGPWDALQHDAPFIGDTPRPATADFYPHDMTEAQFSSFVKAHPDQKDAFLGYFSVIRRNDKGLVAIPYSKFYADKLEPMAKKLEEAAAASSDPSLKKFLTLRAKAFRTNDYLESDKAWMDLNGSLEVTIGPYETYEDQLMGLKASFESFVSLRDMDASKKLEVVGRKMDALEKNLPISAKQRGHMLGRSKGSPISVVHLLYNAGQAGVQTVAYNLPNDERVRKEKGSKKVMMKNVLKGKFDRIVKPIAERVLAKDQLPMLNFDAMFAHILMHEVAHGLGPGLIKLPNGEKTDVNKTLRDQYGAIEEAKADIAGLVSSQYMIDHAIFPRAYDKQIYVAYLTTVFRHIRFGAKEAHGRGALASLNFLIEKGGFTYDAKTERFGVDFEKIKFAVRELARTYLTFEADGDYDGAKAFLEKYAKLSPAETKALAKLKTGIPVDIVPSFPIAKAL